MSGDRCRVALFKKAMLRERATGNMKLGKPRPIRSVIQDEVASLERKMTDRFDWLEERLEWISQEVRHPSGKTVVEVAIHPGCYPTSK